MPTDAIKQFALRFLPDRVLQKLKKIHYAKALRAASTNGEPDLKVVRYLAGLGGRVVDAGANFGVYTKALAEMVGPTGRVYSVEPVPLTYDLLAANVKALGLRNVEPFNLALSSDDGETAMEIPKYTSGGENFYEARVISRRPSPSLRAIVVPTRSLDSLFGHLPAIDLVKCDVEGHELACLRGAASLLRDVKPAWLIEVSGNPDQADSNAAQVFALMGEAGYAPFWFDGRHLRERQRGERSVNTFFLARKHLRLIPEDLMRSWPRSMAA